VLLDVVAADPGSPAEGQLWYNSSEKSVKVQGPGGALIASISNATVTANGDTTTSSGSDVVVNGMTLTPGAGTYLVLFASDWSNSANNGTQFASCYANGVKVGASERQYARSTTSKRDGMSIICLATVADGQAIDIRWRVSGGTGTLGNRTFTLIKVG
jgi:hypothetical protein